MDVPQEWANAQARYRQLAEQMMAEGYDAQHRERSFIYEMPVYCESMKVWRILNLSTGIIYGMEYLSEQEAISQIPDGKCRGDRTVRLLSSQNLQRRLNPPQ